MSGEFENEVYEYTAEVIDYSEQISALDYKLDDLNSNLVFIKWFVVLIFLFSCILHKRGCF